MDERKKLYSREKVSPTLREFLTGLQGGYDFALTQLGKKLDELNNEHVNKGALEESNRQEAMEYKKLYDRIPSREKHAVENAITERISSLNGIAISDNKEILDSEKENARLKSAALNYLLAAFEDKTMPPDTV